MKTQEHVEKVFNHYSRYPWATPRFFRLLSTFNFHSSWRCNSFVRGQNKRPAKGAPRGNRTSDPGLSALSSLQLHMTEGHMAASQEQQQPRDQTIQTNRARTDRPSREWGPLEPLVS